jgi:diaminohydroxyphosphoribosylaminopyrimidine deaminase/5-amino-6-(5-phosphoribosylamino)uracil reductase
MTTGDEVWMRRAIELAERGRGQVEPNPLVGAVIVRDGQPVGEGWHEQYGQPHAEINALAAAGDAARGATLYVTLEPCCHHGKTPPCTDAILRAGIGRVVAALEDPFPLVAGAGAVRLRTAGLPVDIGPCADPARRQNAPYLKLLGAGRPYVHAKWAMTLDGKIATRTGDSKWISSQASRHIVHRLRRRMDGIIVGIGTALADDPLLTARPPGSRTACRVVMDSLARLPLESQLVRTAREVPTLVAVTPTAAPAARDRLRALGCEVLTVPADDAGRPALRPLLAEFGRRRWTNLLVEGGAAVFGSFLDAGLIDEVHVFMAPRLLGGQLALTPMAGLGTPTVAQGLKFQVDQVEQVEGDVYWHGWLNEIPNS